MRRICLAVAIWVGAVAVPLCRAATDPVVGDPPPKAVAAPVQPGVNAPSPETAPAADLRPEFESSSRVLLLDAPEPNSPVESLSSAGGGKSKAVYEKRAVAPFSAVAIGLKLGIGGIGIDVATPLATKLNLRVGASFFSFNPNLVEDGIDIIGNIQLESVTESFDFFPFGNDFRVSPGVVFYNGNHITAAAKVAGGQTFSLNDVSYISDPADPANGSFDLSFGHQLAPSLTLGFGNMIPRKGGHWSMPLELGVEYIGRTPRIALNLGGSACQGGTTPMYCGAIATDPTTMQNVQGEQTTLNNDIPSFLRFFPIASLGVSYRFGHNSSR